MKKFLSRLTQSVANFVLGFLPETKYVPAISRDQNKPSIRLLTGDFDGVELKVNGAKANPKTDYSSSFVEHHENRDSIVVGNTTYILWDNKLPVPEKLLEAAVSHEDVGVMAGKVLDLGMQDFTSVEKKSQGPHKFVLLTGHFEGVEKRVNGQKAGTAQRNLGFIENLGLGDQSQNCDSLTVGDTTYVLWDKKLPVPEKLQKGIGLQKDLGYVRGQILNLTEGGLNITKNAEYKAPTIAEVFAENEARIYGARAESDFVPTEAHPDEGLSDFLDMKPDVQELKGSNALMAHFRQHADSVDKIKLTSELNTGTYLSSAFREGRDNLRKAIITAKEESKAIRAAVERPLPYGQTNIIVSRLDIAGA